MVGIFGNHAGSCVVCLSGTDTALAFEGEIEWLAAVLITLGIPKMEAIATVRDRHTPLEAIDGDHRYRAVFRVCANCVENSTFARIKPVVLHTGANIPIVRRAA